MAKAFSNSTTIDWPTLQQTLQDAARRLQTEFEPTPDDIQNRLQKRAEEIAQPPAETPTGERLTLLAFQLAQETYALEAQYIAEVVPLRQLTPIPCTPHHVLGIINIRGRMVSVLDLRHFFELPISGLSDLNCVVVIANPRMEFGLLTDRIVGMHDIFKHQLREKLAHLNGIRGDYLLGVTAAQWAVLDAEKLLSDPRLVVNETV